MQIRHLVRRWLRLVVLTALALSLIGGAAACSKRPSAIENAAKECQSTQKVADGGQTVTFVVNDEPSSDKDVWGWSNADKFLCLMDELDAPSYLREHINQTRALDGQQTDSWDDFEARWTFHPDDGLSITIREA